MCKGDARLGKVLRNTILKLTGLPMSSRRKGPGATGWVGQLLTVTITFAGIGALGGCLAHNYLAFLFRGFPYGAPESAGWVGLVGAATGVLIVLLIPDSGQRKVQEPLGEGKLREQVRLKCRYCEQPSSANCERCGAPYCFEHEGGVRGKRIIRIC